MRGIFEIIRERMIRVKNKFSKHSYLPSNMNKRGDAESDYSLDIVLMVIIIVIIIFAIGILLFKGSGAIDYIARLFRGG